MSVTRWRLRPETRLPASKPRAPPASVVLTLWLSTTPAVGEASLPAYAASATGSRYAEGGGSRSTPRADRSRALGHPAARPATAARPGRTRRRSRRLRSARRHAHAGDERKRSTSVMAPSFLAEQASHDSSLNITRLNRDWMHVQDLRRHSLIYLQINMKKSQIQLSQCHAMILITLLTKFIHCRKLANIILDLHEM